MSGVVPSGRVRSGVYASRALFFALLWSSLTVSRDNTNAASAQGVTPPSPQIQIGSNDNTVKGKRPIGFHDILSVRTIKEPQLSPDGKLVAFLVSQSFVECNCVQTALYTVSTGKNRTFRKLAQESSLSNLQWNPSGTSLTYLSTKTGAVQLWSIDARGGAGGLLIEHRANVERSLTAMLMGDDRGPIGISDYRWSPDGRSIAFTAEPPSDARVKEEAEAKGFLYDEERMEADEIGTGDWGSADHTVELWVYRLATGQEHRLWQSAPSWLPRIGQFVWSNDSRRIALSSGDQKNVIRDDVSVVDVTNGSVQELLHAVDYVNGLGWSDDESTLALLQRDGSRYFGELSLWRGQGSAASTGGTVTVVDRLFSRAYTTVGWTGGRVVFASNGRDQKRMTTGLYAYNASTGDFARLTSPLDKVSDCSRSVGVNSACVWQSPSDPPQPAVVNLSSGHVTKLGDVNPELSAVELAPVKELHWSNKFGVSTNGFLLLPKGSPPNGGVPLVIMAYGVDGDFVTSAGSALTSYPAQAFVRDGFAVLIVNSPPYDDWEGNDFSKGARAWGYSPLASLEAVIDRLASEGSVDRAHVGFMGHSWGGFWVQFAASHSNLFRAVELHNGGTHSEPGTYFVAGNKAHRDYQAHYMGGGPYPADALENYKDFSASMTADRVRSAVLLESDSFELASTIEYFTALRNASVPVELYVYPNGGHIFTKPAQLLASMQRNLDWFEYWLMDTRNVPSEDPMQYPRWDRLAADRAARNRPDMVTRAR
jgi:dipeptidyl aminopeptidase/acylaminoacyl peptidase